MKNDRRNSQPAVPDNLDEYLTFSQFGTLREIMQFGWSLYFIRRPKFLPPIVVVVGPDKQSIGILGEDGRVDYQADIQLRA